MADYPNPLYVKFLFIAKAAGEAIRSGSDPLPEIAKSLRGLMEFLNSTPDLEQTGASLPFQLLHGALHDLERGAKPTLLFDRPAPSHRPSGEFHTEIRAFLAAAVDLLKTHGGLSRVAAVARVADAAKQAGILEAGSEISRGRLSRWYESANQKDGKGVVMETYKAVTTGNAKHAKAGPPGWVDRRLERIIHIAARHSLGRLDTSK